MTDTFHYDDYHEFDSTFAEGAYYSKNGDLILVTTGGAELLYSNVPQQVWSDLIEADSTGNFFQSHIRGVYDYQGESPYTFFQSNPSEIAPGESKVMTGDGTVLIDSSTASTVDPIKVEVVSPNLSIDGKMLADSMRRTLMTPNEARDRAGLPPHSDDSPSDDSGREYVVSATFATFEEAHVLFSYAEAAAKHASLSVYNTDE